MLHTAAVPPINNFVFTRGEPCSFESLYDAYSAALFGCIRQWVKDENLAAQFLEKSFLQIWFQCQNMDCAPDKLFPWMYGICRRVVKAEMERV